MNGNTFYHWLYDHYAKPYLEKAPRSPIYQAQEQIWLAMAEQLPDRLQAVDLLESMKCHWGTLAFALGVQTGILLTVGTLGRDSDITFPAAE